MTPNPILSAWFCENIVVGDGPQTMEQQCDVMEMTSRYAVKPLGEGQILKAYPLVQSAAPHLTLDRWVDYARALYSSVPCEHVGGIMSVQNPQGYIYGVYCHVMELNIEYGRILRISIFAAANLSDPADILDPLIDSMCAIAQDRNCRAVHVDLPESMRDQPRPVQGVFNAFKMAGYAVKSVALVRSLNAE